MQGFGWLRVTLSIRGYERPILLQGVRIVHLNVARGNVTHHQIHPGEVKGVGLELLSEVANVGARYVVLLEVRAHRDQQGARAAGRIVDLDLIAPFEMEGHDLGHELRDLMWGIELACFLTGACREVADQVFIDKAQHIVALLFAQRDITDDVDNAA